MTSKIVSLAAEAARTKSGRWRRKHSPEGTITAKSVQELLDKASGPLSRLLAYTEMYGMDALRKLENVLFQPLLTEGIYSVGDSEAIAFVVLPSCTVHGKQFFFPAVFIPLQVEDDFFFIWVERNQGTGTRTYAAWRSHTTKPWPEQEELLRELHDRTEAALQVLLTLEVPTWAELMAEAA